MSEKTEQTRRAKSKIARAVLNEIKQSMNLMSKFCIGCSILKSEGARSYSERAPIVNDCCIVCHKPIYHKNMENK